MANPESDLKPGFLEFVDPDTVILRPGAQHTSLEDLGSALSQRALRGRFYLVIDFTRFKHGIDAETRERGFRLVKSEWLLGCVYVKASTPIRLALKVLQLMNIGGSDFPSEHVATPEEVDAVLARFRRQAAVNAA